MYIKFDPLGDEKSCLELIQHTNDNDMMIVNAARVSFAKDIALNDGEILERDTKLIKYLLIHDHMTPFEHNLITFNVSLPIFIARQWIRHRIGVSYNEVSRRYTNDNIEFYIPSLVRTQSKSNKQGSEDPSFTDDYYELCDNFNYDLTFHCQSSLERYSQAVDNGVALEEARMFLPLNLYTRWYFTCNFRSILHWYSLRSDLHAQWEIRQYAECVSHVMWELFPVSWPIAVDVLQIKNKILKPALQSYYKG